jgi:hypothetical protein
MWKNPKSAMQMRNANAMQKRCDAMQWVLTKSAYANVMQWVLTKIAYANAM